MTSSKRSRAGIRIVPTKVEDPRFSIGTGAQRAKARYLDAIFKAYDVRGAYPDEINEEVAYKIGRAAAEFLKGRGLIVGRDTRFSSLDLSKVVSEGIRDQGVNVIDIGLTTTPMFCFAVIKGKLKGGVMITASHNPSSYNGFKIVRKNAMPVSENSGLEEIKELVRENEFGDKHRGELKVKYILKDYVEHILDFAHVKDIDPFKIIIDTANGSAGLIVPEIFKRIQVDLIQIFADFNGYFPGHDPNPSNAENTKSLQEKVLSEQADLGVAFDGDGDRILFINEKGERINPDFIAALIIHYFFKNTGKILYTIVSSRIIKEEIEDSGNIPVCSKVGYAFIKEKLSKERIVFACEPSGHYYFKENYFIESPFIVLLKVLEILSKTKMPLSELIKPFQKYYQERINIELKNMGNEVSQIMREIEKKYKKIGKISKLDGLTIELSDWWFNIRLSNTEPVIRLTIEANSKELLEEKKKELAKLIPF